MAKNSKQKEKESSSKKNRGDSSYSTLKQETKHSIFSILSFLVALFFILAAFNSAGPSGKFFYTLFSALFGVGYALVPIIAIMLGITFLKADRPTYEGGHIISAILFLISGLGLIDIASVAHKGGIVGKGVSYPFLMLFEKTFSVIFLCAVLVISLLVLFDVKFSPANFFVRIQRLFGKKIEEKEVLGKGELSKIEESKASLPQAPEEPKESIRTAVAKAIGIDKKEDEFEMAKDPKWQHSTSYTPPPLSLLEKDKGKPQVGDIKANSNIIKRTLQNFGIEVEMDEITIGPTVTRYALKPAEGVKLSRIAGLQSDLALALAAHPIRMELPIPGKSLVGIEIPNKSKSTVGLATLLSDDKFQNAAKPLMIAMGRAIDGKSFFGNLAKMPHMLIAGTTGSGKSVTIHSIVTSLLYRNGPSDMQFIMVDPKRVELTLYNKIPHLRTPVITDPKKAILALKWAAKEMDRRYDILEKSSVRDIESYHNNVVKGTPEGEEVDRMPYIVIIIDELADIMQSYPRELETAIVRLAQMSRAVGIHLILSTQRPEVSVITGLIKANVPVRVALRVSSSVDSRTILDAGGAEKLLGAGDMLYSGGDGQPNRLQSAFISEDEVKKVVAYLADSYKNEIRDDIDFSGSVSADKSIFDSTFDDNKQDDLYEDARSIVIESGQASTSYLQRKLGVGYARAARLIDMLEEQGVVGPKDGSKQRDVLVKSVEEERAQYPEA